MIRHLTTAVLIVAPLCGLSAEHSRSADEASVRLVADSVIQRTSYRLLDTATGKTFGSSDDLAPSKTVIIESHFNGWYYQNMMVLAGMERLGAVLDDPNYKKYPDRNLDFIARHLPYFRKQNEAGLLPNPHGESPDKRITYYFNFRLPWMTGLAHPWIEHGLRSGDPACKEYINRFTNYVENAPRDETGQFLNLGAVRTDDAALMAPGMLRIARAADAAKSAKYFADAAAQVLGAHKRLFHAEDQLYRHGWEAKTNKFSAAYWGRGNGWMALAHVDALENLPESHPLYQEILANYRAQMAGLRRWQAKDGGWKQVMDHPESWIETSCTGMFTYALARGVNQGWLDPSYAADALRGWKVLREKIKTDGILIDACPSTHHGDLNYYLARPRKPDDPHAYGPFLLAAAEILGLTVTK